MNKRTFKTVNDLELIIKANRTSVTLEIPKDKDKDDDNFLFIFNDNEHKELLDYIIEIAYKVWPTFTPKEASSWASDYDEYYDKKLDLNGYLKIVKSGLSIERPSSESLKLYQFNKRRLESFIYDIQNKKSKEQEIK